tara:strand:+ start:4473 stop:5252 length:780 start_codon:yes stop_codon:yes gene_type:complete
MKICVLIKQVPDQNSPLSLSDDQRTIVDTNITWISNESDNYALEEALLIKEKQDSEIVVCTLGKESSIQVIKDALAKGADRGIFISDNDYQKYDILTVGKIFYEKLKDENFDLILTGLQSDDQGNSQLGIILSELFNMSNASLVMETEIIDNKSIRVKRELENGWFQYSNISIPASISIQSGINTPRYATLKGIMMVKNKPIEETSISDLNINDLSPKTELKKIYIPEKSKETKFIEGTNDEIIEELISVLKNEIKVID